MGLNFKIFLLIATIRIWNFFVTDDGYNKQLV
jgi:hypothetical protein